MEFAIGQLRRDLGCGGGWGDLPSGLEDKFHQAGRTLPKDS